MVATNEIQQQTANVNATHKPNHLRSVSDASEKLALQFAEKYGHGDMSAAFNHLDSTFFKSSIEKGTNVSNYHRMQVITVALETDLNPYNNELYPIFTNWGDLKVIASMDGWMKIATAENITKREFKYSDDTEKVEINGNNYTVPMWIECVVEHAEKGTSQAREYFREVFDNSQQHLPSWSRPARMLSHVAFIQCLRRMLRITSLGDSDIVADISREYEVMSTQANFNNTSPTNVSSTASQQTDSNNNVKTQQRVASKPQTSSTLKARGLNINLDDIDIIDLGDEKDSADAVTPAEQATDTTQQEVTAAPEVVTPEIEAPVDSAPEKVKEKVAKKPASKTVAKEPKAQETVVTKSSTQEPVNELNVPRNVVGMFKPLFQRVLSGSMDIEVLKRQGAMITNELAKTWFAQQIEIIEQRI